MHPCLNVDEILRLLACELVASGAKGTAVSLACCYKTLEDPALDVLWATQNRLLVLFESLPGDVQNEDECTVSATPQYLFFVSLKIRLDRPLKDARRR